MVSIYSIPINSTLGIARHYYLSEDGNFNNSVGWGTAGVEWQGKVELTPEELKRIYEYADIFGAYNVHSNNCEMFAWYVKTGKQYSGQTEEIVITKFGAALVSLVQPVHTVRSIKYLEIEKSIISHLQANLDEVRKGKLLQVQATRDEFWQRRDAGLS
ncbi:NC domain-containing protein [Nostoc sp. CENA543]|uniref:NC domain-containing protein n=1 Tax=Nostoc sp. CENA543 TaxID=1869241 RepID=UPI000CA2712F|nr:NC domain-containing protein [Nostoc sp. CENA543]AUS99013.1 NC domain-containing protein [Nostoc sp. CENA543]